MINDTYGIYYPNRAIALLNAKLALPEDKALHYLYESAGLEPWLGSEKNNVPLESLGEQYYELTDKGLTKELGFVGYYGEVIDWMTSMYDATRPSPDKPGDEKLKAQLIKAAHARGVFRYPRSTATAAGPCAETLIGWRDQGHYPGDITYAQRSTWDASPLNAAATTLDPQLVGSVQQMFEDNQFYPSLQERMEDHELRVTASLLCVPDDYDLLKAQPPSALRLPMATGQPDFVFSDEEDGVVVIKHGQEIVYVSLYWRARHAINDLARVHDILPNFDRIAVVQEKTTFEPSGMTFTRPDWVDFGFANGGHKYPGDLHSAYAGEKLPIAKIPDGVKFKPGNESPYAGKGDYYMLNYGPYLIGMNMTKDKTFQLQVPPDAKSVKELVSGQTKFTAGENVAVKPRSTVVLFLDTKQVQ